jgi:hypothetical protein
VKGYNYAITEPLGQNLRYGVLVPDQENSMSRVSMKDKKKVDKLSEVQYVGTRGGEKKTLFQVQKKWGTYKLTASGRGRKIG